MFTIRDIDVNAGYDSIKTQISDACSKGIVERVIRGVYHKPKYNKKLSRYVPYDITDVIYAIARMNGWYIIPSGNACMNIVGLSTQVPSKYVYLSDGPYKKYEIGKITIEFKHRTSKNMPKSIPAATLVQSIKSKGITNIDNESMKAISEYVKNNDIDINEMINVSMWIKNIIRDACHESI